MTLYVGNELFGGDLLITKEAIKNTVISWFNLYNVHLYVITITDDSL